MQKKSIQEDQDLSINSNISLVFSLSFISEVIIQIISFILPVIIIKNSIKNGNIFIISISIVMSLYIFVLFILLLSAIVIRISPKPKLGKLDKQKDVSKYIFKSSIIFFAIRMPGVRYIMNVFPFPGYIFYRICGANIKISANIYGALPIPDPYLISIGENSTIGANSILVGHFVGADRKIILGKVEIGKNVLVGAGSIIWSNVKIGDNSIVAELSSVKPGTIIPKNQLWGGVPAKFIKNL